MQKAIWRESQPICLNEGELERNDVENYPQFRLDGTKITDFIEYEMRTLVYALSSAVSAEIAELMSKGYRQLDVSYQSVWKIEDTLATLQIGAILKWEEGKCCNE